MYSLAKFIVKMRKVFSLIFIALIVFSAFSFSWVNVENDITTYLADSFEAKRGLNLMKQEFVAYATADIMVENIDRVTARQIYEMLQDTYGVMMVNYDSGPSHYKDHTALYNITFEGSASKKPTINAMERVKRELADYDFCVKSDSFSNLTKIIADEMQGVLVIVIFVVVGVLVFTSTTYAEVLVLLATFLAAAIINMGTNFIFGTISFVSNSVAIVLQLALSVDYAIIFCNRYKEEHETKPVEEAVISALSLSIPEIFASSLTTIAGLAAMTFMQFRLGFDMGICLIKAIILSLLSVFLLMPALLMGLGDLMDRTRHKSFVPKISFVGRFAHKTRYIIPPLFIMLVVFAYMSFGKISYAYSMDLVDCIHRNEEDIAAQRIIDRFGENNMIAVIVPSGDYEKESALIAELEACDEVNSVLGLANVEAMDGYMLTDKVNYKEFMELADVDETAAQALFAYYAAGHDYRTAAEELESVKAPLVDVFLVVHDMQNNGRIQLTKAQKEMINDLYSQLNMAKEQLESDNYSRIVAYIDLPAQGDETFGFLDRVHVIAGKYYDDVTVTGGAVSAKDFNSSFEGDTNIVSILSISFVMLILLLTFKSFGMPLLLILVIQGSIWLNFALSVWSGSYVFFMCYLIVSAIQMGANIDYAIVISSRYNEFRQNGISQRNAAIETLNLAFPTVITSGLMMVIAGLLIGTRVSQVVIAGMGLYVGTGTAITLVLVNFVLPQILIFGDSFVRATTIKLRASGKRMLAAALLASLVIALLSLPLSYKGIKTKYDASHGEYSDILTDINEIKPVAALVRDDRSDYSAAKTDFAEHVVTDIVGSQLLADGEKEYADGKEQLDDARAKLESGEEAFAYGVSQYNDGKTAYAEAEQQLREGQALYDENAAKLSDAKTQLEQGRMQLALGEAELALLAGPYNDGITLRASYENNLAKAQEAAQNGDAELEAQYNALAQADYENLAAGYLGMSYDSIIEQYESTSASVESGRAQIAAAEEQISAGEIALAEAKQQLDAGYRELAAGKAELDAAEKQIEGSKWDLESGKYKFYQGMQELEKAEEKLEDGRETLNENKDKLAEDINALDTYAATGHQLGERLETLSKNPRVAALAKDSSDDVALCSAAELLYQRELDTLEKNHFAAGISALLLLLAAALGLTALLSERKFYPAAISALLAAVSAVVWFIYARSFGVLILLAAICLLLASAVYALVYSKA